MSNNPKLEPTSRRPSKAFNLTSEQELAALFEAVALQVNYIDFRDKLTADVFRSLVNLVIYDRYWSFDDAQVAKFIKVDEKQLGKLRKDPQYKAIEHEIEAAFDRVAEGTYKDLVSAPGFQRRLFYESSRLAFHSKDPKVAERMIATLTDRVKPKLYDRAQTGPQVLVLQGEHVQVLTEALKEAKKLPPVIDGEYSEVHKESSG